MKDKKVKKLWLLMISVLSAITSFAQIQIQNPSFEGPTGPGLIPSSWITCTGSPDTDPTSFEPKTLNFKASNGLTYIGIYAYPPDNHYYESFSQMLLCSLSKGGKSKLTLDLAYLNTNDESPGGILFYAGFGTCDTAQLLWKSPNLDTVWNTYTVNFIPNNDYNYIIFWPYANTPPYYSSYIVIDNLSPTIEIDNAGKVLAHANNTEINAGDCVQLSAQVANTVATNISWSSIPSGFTSNQLNAGTVCPTQNTKYIVTITDTCGLISTDTVGVTMKDFIVPTLLRPQMAGENRFKILGLPSGSALLIYNMLGQQLFSSTDYQNNFNIAQLPASLYFYRLTTPDGKAYKGKFEVM